MKALLILDVAHGIDTPGKRSPDGKFLEYKYSRETARVLMNIFGRMKKGYEVVCPFVDHINEPGLSNRVKHYNSLCDRYDFVFVFSLHNNAASLLPKWSSAEGIEFWTDSEDDESDMLANIISDKMREMLPAEKFRLNRSDDASKDKNFTVIHGYSLKGGGFVKRRYNAVLLETLFMDNISDYNKLLSPEWAYEYRKVLVLALNEVFKSKGYAN